MSVRAKFRVTEITRRTARVSTQNAEGQTIYEDKEGQSIKLAPVYPDKSPENKEFYQYTPSGSVELTTVNKSAGDYFELDGEYYLDFTKAE